MRESKREEAKEKVEKKEDSIQIQEEKLEKIKEEMDEEKNRSNEKNEKKYNEAFKNIIIGCGIMVYFAILLFGKGKIPVLDYIRALKVIIVIDLLASIVLLEVGFRKDKFNIGLHGIEMAFVGGLTIFILDLFCKTKDSFNIWISSIVTFVAIYYIIKAIIIAIKKEK